MSLFLVCSLTIINNFLSQSITAKVFFFFFFFFFLLNRFIKISLFDLSQVYLDPQRFSTRCHPPPRVVNFRPGSSQWALDQYFPP